MENLIRFTRCLKTVCLASLSLFDMTAVHMDIPAVVHMQLPVWRAFKDQSEATIRNFLTSALSVLIVVNHRVVKLDFAFHNNNITSN